MFTLPRCGSDQENIKAKSELLIEPIIIGAAALTATVSECVIHKEVSLRVRKREVVFYAVRMTEGKVMARPPTYSFNSEMRMAPTVVAEPSPNRAR
jgi:hypothetical protein